MLYNFTNGVDGGEPLAGVIEGKTAGTLFGTTWFGGNYDLGTVFELTQNGSTYTETTLHSFAGKDGTHPAQLGNLIADKKGALYGTTYQGGSGNCMGNGNGCGVVFKVTRSAADCINATTSGHSPRVEPVADPPHR